MTIYKIKDRVPQILDKLLNMKLNIEKFQDNRKGIRIVDSQIRLIPYYRNDEASLPWYQDADICKQVDNIDTIYNLDTLHRMYDYLRTHGECYYIEYQGELVGDVSLQDKGEISIVIRKESQNQHIGRRCVIDMLKLARALKL